MRLSLKERRTEFANATLLNRKSGGAQWSDLQFPRPGQQPPRKAPTLHLVIPTEAKRSGGICCSVIH